MGLDPDKLREYIYDPSKMQSVILDYVEQAVDGGKPVVDPTNPFTMLLEAITVTASNTLIDTKALLRKTYPVLASNQEELYHHVSEDLMANMNSVPSEAKIRFYINVLDLKQKGYRPLNSNYNETIIPIGTKIIVKGITLTILNDILIRLYDNNTILVEQQVNDNDVAYDNIGVLIAELQHDSDGVVYIVFETYVKQVSLTSRNIALTPSTGFTAQMKLTNKYFYSTVEYKTGNSNKYINIPKSFTEEYIDPLSPMCCVSIYDTVVEFKLPDVYILNKLVSGNVNITLYETNGYMYLPLNKLRPEEFTIMLGNTTTSPSAATSPNILMVCDSNDVLEGGSNGKSLTEFRSDIIHNSMGDIDLPVTEHQLSVFARQAGYNVKKILDTVTSRLYTASKEFPVFKNELIYSTKDIFFNTVEFSIRDIESNKNVNVYDNYTVIKAGTMFRHVHGKLVMVDNDEQKAIQSLTGEDLADKLNAVTYYYLPFYYIIQHSEAISTVDVYEMDNPKVMGNRIIGKNTSFDHRVNTSQYLFEKTDNGYRLGFSTVSDTEYAKLDPTSVGFQVHIMLNDDVTPVIYEATYDSQNNYWYVDIETRMRLNNSEFDIQNGESLFYNKSMKLNTKALIYAYTTDSKLNDTTKYLLNELYGKAENKRYTILTKEELTLRFGRKLEYIYNKIFSSYTDWKYEKYTEDVPDTYLEDTYEVDTEGNNIFKYIKSGEPIPSGYKVIEFTQGTRPVNGDYKLAYKLLGKKGEIKRNESNEVVYLYRKGDNKRDRNGNLIIDQLAGVVRYIDVCLLEYNYKASTSDAYINYNEMMNDLLIDYCSDSLAKLNSKLLENTKIMYKSNNALEEVVMVIDNNLYSTPYTVRPEVTLYMQESSRLSTSILDGYKVIIGNIFNRFIKEDKITLQEIRDAIKEEVSNNIISVKITGIEESNSEIINIYQNNNKFTLAKKAVIDTNNDLVVQYDIKVNVIYV